MPLTAPPAPLSVDTAAASVALFMRSHRLPSTPVGGVTLRRSTWALPTSRVLSIHQVVGGVAGLPGVQWPRPLELITCVVVAACAAAGSARTAVPTARARLAAAGRVRMRRFSMTVLSGGAVTRAQARVTVGSVAPCRDPVDRTLPPQCCSVRHLRRPRRVHSRRMRRHGRYSSVVMK